MGSNVGLNRLSGKAHKLNAMQVKKLSSPGRYAMSVIDTTVPDGQLSWLNRRLLVGTLQSLRPDRSVVIVRAWEMNVG